MLLEWQHRIVDDKIYLNSIVEADHDVKGHAEDTNSILNKGNITEMLNPVARGF